MSSHSLRREFDSRRIRRWVVQMFDSLIYLLTYITIRLKYCKQVLVDVG